MNAAATSNRKATRPAVLTAQRLDQLEADLLNTIATSFDVDGKFSYAMLTGGLFAELQILVRDLAGEDAARRVHAALHSCRTQPATLGGAAA